MKKIIYFSFLLLVLNSCGSDSKVIRINNQSDIGNVIKNEFKNFASWSFDDFRARQSYNQTVKKEIEADLGFAIFDQNFSQKKSFSEMKNGGKRRLINWTKIEFKELSPSKELFTGKISGDEYVIFEVIYYEPEGKNTFAFIPFFKFDGKEYQLIMMWFDW